MWRGASVVDASADRPPAERQGGTGTSVLMPEAAVAVRDVTLTYRSKRGTVTAVEDVELEARKGEFVCLVGPSGCGKSSILSMVAGLRRPSRGLISVFGDPVDGAVTGLGMVFQEDLLLPWRTVIANVLIQSEIRRMPRATARARALELLRQSGLGGFEERFPHELSGGMRQRCAIARALVHSPPLLLMDEPFSAIDALTREELNEQLVALWQQERPTVLFVTHAIDEAVYLADRVLVMTPRPGRIVEDVTIDLDRPRPQECRDTPEFREYVRRIRAVLARSGARHRVEG